MALENTRPELSAQGLPEAASKVADAKTADAKTARRMLALPLVMEGAVEPPPGRAHAAAEPGAQGRTGADGARGGKCDHPGWNT